MELLRACGWVLGFCLGVILVAPPVIFLWWPLVLHDFLWREVYQLLFPEFPGMGFWRDAAVISVLQILLPSTVGHVVSRSVLARFGGGWTDKATAAFLFLRGAGFCLLV